LGQAREDGEKQVYAWKSGIGWEQRQALEQATPPAILPAAAPQAERSVRGPGRAGLAGPPHGRVWPGGLADRHRGTTSGHRTGADMRADLAQARLTTALWQCDRRLAALREALQNWHSRPHILGTAASKVRV
jgi:hypothetical protein